MAELNQEDINFILEKIKQAKTEESYYNIDTKRLNKETTIKKSKPKYRNEKFKCISNDEISYNSVILLLTNLVKINDIGPSVSVIPAVKDTSSQIVSFEEDSSLDEIVSEDKADDILPNINLKNKTTKATKSNIIKNSRNNSKAEITTPPSSFAPPSSLAVANKTTIAKRKTSIKASAKTIEPRKPIPLTIRFQVWRNAFTDAEGKCLMDGKCFCCLTEIALEKWHCGHIMAHASGGETDADNMRPVCIDCNLKMGTMNMFEYIVLNDLLGIVNLKGEDRRNVFRAIEVTEIVFLTEKRLQTLIKLGKLTKAQANLYTKKITSKRGTLSDRVDIMEEVLLLHKTAIL